MVDTLRYTVIEPEGLDAEARDAWRALKVMGRKTAEDAAQLMDLYHRYQRTPYGPMALYRIIRLTSPNFMPYPANTGRNWLKREMVLTYPDYPTIGIVLREYERENTPEETRLLNEEIYDSVPNTLAGRLAAKYLALQP